MFTPKMRVLTFVAVCLFAVAATAAPQETEEVAQPASTLTGVVIGKAEKQLTLWTKNGRKVLRYNADTIMPQRKLKDGLLVWVRTTGPGSSEAAQIVIVDEQISVVGRLGREHAVIGTTAPGRSPSHVIVRSKDGREMFVLDPKKFRQPLPKPGERVAVTYRVENVTPPNYIATGIVVLPPALDDSPVKITYSEVPQPVEVAETVEPEPAPAYEPEQIAALPQTARRTSLAGVVGLLLVAAGVAIRRLA